MAAWTGVAGASAVLGLLASGLLLQVWSWRSVFGLNVVLAVVAIIGTLRVVPESAHPEAAPRDIVGTALSVAGLTAVVFSIIEAPTAGWTAARTVIGLAGGLAVLGAFIVWELRQTDPLLDPRLFRRPPFAAGALSIAVQFSAFFGFVFVFLQYLQLVRGDAPLVAAVGMLPLAAGLVPASRLAPRLTARTGTAPLCTAGLLLIAGALLVLRTADAESTYWVLAGGLVALGIGMGLAMTPATAAITDALPVSEQGVASAVNDLARELGGALGIAVLGSVLNATYRDRLVLPDLPPAAADGARESLAVASRLGGAVADQAGTAFVAGLHAALLCAAITVAVTALAVGGMSARRRTTNEPDRSDDAVAA